MKIKIWVDGSMEIINIILIFTLHVIGSIMRSVLLIKRRHPRQEFRLKFLNFYTISSLLIMVFTSNFKYMFLIINHIICDKICNSSTRIIITPLILEFSWKKDDFYNFLISLCIYLKQHIYVSYYYSNNLGEVWIIYLDFF
jgi:hypothetical protein